jgi:hypothetical protein
MNGTMRTADPAALIPAVNAMHAWIVDRVALLRRGFSKTYGTSGVNCVFVSKPNCIKPNKITAVFKKLRLPSYVTLCSYRAGVTDQREVCMADGEHWARRNTCLYAHSAAFSLHTMGLDKDHTQ